VKGKKYVLSILLFFVLLIGTYYFVLKDYSIADFLECLKLCNPTYILLSFVFVSGYAFFASLYLKRILYHFGKKISWYQALGYLCTEIYFSAITPSSIGGQPVQMVEMSRDDIPYRINSIVVLLNTVIYKIALIVLAIFAFIFYSNVIFSRSSLFSWLVILGFVTTILVIFLFLLLIYSKKVIPKLANFLFRVLKKIPFLKSTNDLEHKFSLAIGEYQECAIFTKKHPSVLFESFVILLLQRVCLLSVSCIIYIAFGLNSLNVLEIISLQVCITLAADFVPSPGGVGISEGLLLGVNQMIYGSTLATAAMMLLRGISFYVVVLLSGMFYLIFHFIKRKGAISYDRNL